MRGGMRQAGSSERVRIRQCLGRGQQLFELQACWTTNGLTSGPIRAASDSELGTPIETSFLSCAGLRRAAGKARAQPPPYRRPTWV